MGRKSSAKAQTRSAGPPEPPGPSRSFSPLLMLALVAVVVVVGGFIYARSSDPQSATPASAQPSETSPPAPVAQVPENRRKPHSQKSLPPLPVQPYTPPRPPDVVRAAYVFAAEHPEVLSYVPCFCGCERSGHRGNHDCFVKARSENGDVTEWDPHGLDCTVCIDVATEARQMFTSGANASNIRAAIDKKWANFKGGHTPTPHPPGK